MTSSIVRTRFSIILLGSAVAWGGVAGCMKDDTSITTTSCVVNAQMPCNTVLAGDKDAGVSLGLIGHLTGWTLFSAAAGIAKTAGDLWIASLQMIALPLVLVLTLSAIPDADTNLANGM